MYSKWVDNQFDLYYIKIKIICTLESKLLFGVLFAVFPFSLAFFSRSYSSIVLYIIFFFKIFSALFSQEIFSFR